MGFMLCLFHILESFAVNSLTNDSEFIFDIVIDKSSSDSIHINLSCGIYSTTKGNAFLQ